MIKSISFKQSEIIQNILTLEKIERIEIDSTYSKGNFYKNTGILQPSKKFDLIPQTGDTVMANANKLPLENNSVTSIMFDPPFLVGYTKDKPTGKMGKRFNGFAYIKDLWKW